jgi:two-component system, OmpR family, sensor histidine kinase TctE
MNKKRSLRTEIILRLSVPVIFFMAVETVLSYFTTLHYVDEAYDRWLLDSARSLMQEIKLIEGQAVVDLPPEALAIFKWDDLDKTYFNVISEERGLLAGDAFLPETLDSSQETEKPIYFNAIVNQESVRVVSIKVPLAYEATETIHIHVAETQKKRRVMMLDILMADLIPQILLVIMAGFYLLRGVKRGLQPLHELADEIAQRSPQDLSLIPESHVFQEVHTLTDTINNLFNRLALAIAGQQRFISNAAHQLRTPLAGLKLQAERALREKDLAEMKPALEQIQVSADRMSHLITQLLVLAKSGPLEAGYKLKPLALCQLVKALAIDYAPSAIQHNMELVFEGPDNDITIQGDEILLRELLGNLIDNAIKYGHENGVVVISVLTKPYPSLIVEDDGPGIPAAEQEKIFERFYRIPGSLGDGCGLGLAIVKEIALLHQAQLNLGSSDRLGGGRFEVIFNGKPEK